MSEKLSVGRRLHYILNGECRPADVTRVWPDGSEKVNVTVLLDGFDNYGEQSDPLHTRRSGLKVGRTLHWPEKV